MDTQAKPVLPLETKPAGQGKQWVHLLPRGRFTGKDGRGPYFVENVAQIIERSMQGATSRGLPFDYDHQIDRAPQHGGTAPASGWIVSMEGRADGIWGLVAFTPKARAAVDDHEYRFVSPVFQHDAGGQVLSLARASLTNNPNLGQLTALNSAGTPMDPDAFMSSLREALGLDVAADYDAILAAVRTAKTASHSAAPDPTLYVPMAVFKDTVAQLNASTQGLSRNNAETVVDKAIFDRSIPPHLRDWGVSLAMHNMQAFTEFTGGVGKGLTYMVESLTTADPRLKAAMAREKSARGGATTSEIARNMGLTDDDLKTYGGDYA